MKFKKAVALLLALVICISFAACSGGKHSNSEYDDPEYDPDAVKTGLAVISEIRTNEEEPDSISKRTFISTVAAVIVDEDGKICSAKIDVMQIDANLEDNGGVVESPKSRMELQDEYVMPYETELGTTWCDQIGGLEEYSKGKTADELRDAVDYFSGIATDSDLLKVCDIDIGTEIKALIQAVGDARALGADDRNTLKLSITAKNVPKDDEENEMLSYQMDYAAVTLDKKDVITSCIIDESEGQCTIIDGEYKEFPGIYSTKKQLGIQYGMKSSSPIGAEWDEQVKAFEYFAAGKSADELLASVGDDNRTTDADLVSSCTIEINDFVLNVIKAVNM